MKTLILALFGVAVAFAQTPSAPWATVSTLPSAASAVLGMPYIWTQATTANTCPSAGAGGSGGSAQAGCITLDGTSWTALGGAGLPITDNGTTLSTTRNFSIGTTVPAGAPSSSLAIAGTVTASGLPFISATSYGCAGDSGVTNNLTCLNNALAAADALGGGQIYLPAASGSYVVNGCLSIPNHAGSAAWNNQAPFRIFGDGFNIITADQIDMAVPTQGTRLDIRCTSTSAGGVITTTGYGNLEIDHIALIQGADPTTTRTVAGGTLTSIVVATNVGTVTTSTGHGLFVGAIVQVLGSATSALNQEYAVTAVPTSTTFRITTSGVADATYTTGLQLLYTPPIIYSTETALKFHDNLCMGLSSRTTTNNTQTCIVMGGTSATNDSSLNSAYGGYGITVIERNIFSHVTHFAFMRALAQGFQIVNNFGWPSCGSNDSNNGSAIAFEGAALNYVAGNVLGGRYKWGVRVNSGTAGTSGDHNAFVGNISSDNTGQTAVYRFDSTVFSNMVIGTGKQSATSFLSDASGGNITLSGDPTISTNWNGPWNFNSLAYFPTAGQAMKVGEFIPICWTNGAATGSCVSGIQQWGDGVLSITDAANVRNFIDVHLGASYSKRPVQTKLTSTLSATDVHNSVFTNFGAASESDQTLPAAPQIGTVWTFVVAAAQTFKIVANTGQTIRVAGSVSSSGGSIAASTVGNSVTLVYIAANTWVATELVGTWTTT